ncbi:DUF2061 domain-containing protein [Piscinibacter sakaiensis]|uniref:DUF2061 domain-containing protein n=1 Tax=Piscinibacter sakaiensis TaxID=1547922 RepID=A0A0K8NYS7_PISS1|nr:DUF2061 domain-containing protein [Piscinibacter sakaiensis]GAP35070.1 hypothetical protein ISF6_0635 [Piscinibacter sakaiensis]
MAKTATFGVLHLGTSFGVGYLLTGSAAIAGALSLVEPLVNTVMHYFFDKGWDHPAWQQRLARWGRRPAAAESLATSVPG